MIRRGLAPLLAAALSLPSAADASPHALIQSAATAYREGRYFHALGLLADALEADPSNTTAKNYVWTIVRKVQLEKDAAPLSAKELERGLSLARRELSDRRRRTEEVLAGLKVASRRSGARDPRDILAGMEGMDKFFGQDLSAELAGEQARTYRTEILENLSRALQRNAFVTRKDHWRAQGYRAYFNDDWKKAREHWTKALAEDPSDGRLKRDLEDLERILSRREAAERIEDYSRQAALHMKAGDWEPAAETWRAVLKLDPSHVRAKAELVAAVVALEKSRLRKRLKEKTGEGIRIYKEKGDALSAAQVWLEVLQEDPVNEEAREWLKLVGTRIRPAVPAFARPAAPAGRPRPGASFASVEPPRNPERALELYKQGVVLYAQDDPERAVESWKEALRHDPSLNRAREALKQAQAELALQ